MGTAIGGSIAQVGIELTLKSLMLISGMFGITFSSHLSTPTHHDIDSSSSYQFRKMVELLAQYISYFLEQH